MVELIRRVMYAQRRLSDSGLMPYRPAGIVGSDFRKLKRMDAIVVSSYCDAYYLCL